MGISIVQQHADKFLIGMLMSSADEFVIVPTELSYPSAGEAAQYTAKVQVETILWMHKFHGWLELEILHMYPPDLLQCIFPGKISSYFGTVLSTVYLIELLPFLRNEFLLFLSTIVKKKSI
jgi:hypothetical protein